MKSKTSIGFVIAVSTTLALASYAVAWPADSPESADRAVTAWEHLALTHDGAGVSGNRKLSTQIVGLGDEGWELVDVSAVVQDGTTTKTVFYFKRPKSRLVNP